MKILHVTQGYTPALGGTEYLIQRVSEELVRQFDDQVQVFTTNCYNGEAFFTPSLPRMPVGEEVINGVKVRRFPVNSRVSWFFRKIQSPAYHLGLPGNQYLRAWASGPVIPGLQQHIEATSADVLAASSFPLLHMFAVQKAGQRTRRPVVLHGGLHPDDDWGFNRPMIYQTIRRADAYIANTGLESQVLARYGIADEKITPIGVGVDLERFAGIDQTAARQQLGLPEGPLIGFIGQIGAHKGVDTLLRAMPVVWQVYPQAHLLIAGGRTLFVEQMAHIMQDWSAEQRQRVVLRLNFPEEHKPALFNAVDVFAYPSGYESFGIAFLEAWAAKKPVIGCWRGAIPWVVQAGRSGLLVDYQYVDGLAGALIVLLGSPGMRAAMGQAGYELVRQNYTWPHVARKFREVYQEVLQNFKNGNIK